MKQKMFFVLLMALVSSVFFSCGDDEDYTTVFNATLNGANEKPDATASTATGKAKLTFNTKTKIFTVVVTFSGMEATNGHIHKGAADVAGGVVFPFTLFTSPITFTSPALTADQEADLNAGLYYVNLHSTAYPAGEIRGQLLKK